MYPSKIEQAAGHTSFHEHINLAPRHVNDILSDKSTSVRNVIKDGQNRKIYKSGDIEIVIEGKIIVTVQRIG